jgi:cobalt-zinc-cadmium efflux system membrane fusion protein
LRKRLEKHLVTLSLILSCLLVIACNGGTSGSPAAERTAPADKGEIVLTAEQQALAKIETLTVALSDQPEILRVSGHITLADERTWHVGVRTTGLVMEISAGLGDYVQKGQVLARYHADEVRDTRAQYRSAVSSLNRAEAGAALAQRNYERMQTLLGLKAASVQQVDQAKQDLVFAQAEMKNFQTEVDRTKDLLEDDLRVSAEPKPGDETADEVPIFSPASGYIIKKNITPGKIVQPTTDGDTFIIGDLSQVWMLASVRSDSLGKLRAGQSATVTLPGVPSETFAGRITNLGQEIDPITRAMEVRIVLSNAANRLRPGMLATADIPIGERKPALLVPSDAIQQINGQDAVFARTEGTHFTVRAVQAGQTSGGKTLITDGLKPGETIVVRGSFILKSQLLKSTMEGE